MMTVEPPSGRSWSANDEGGSDFDPVTDHWLSTGEYLSHQAEAWDSAYAGGSSGAFFYDDGAITSVDRMAQVLSPNLPPASGPSFVVIDDGWEAAWGDWIANSKFPQGLVAAAQAIKARGLTHVVECGPGKVLAGMVKRIDAELVGAALFDPATLADVQGVLA